MSKFSKFVQEPKKFFKDAINNRVLKIEQVQAKYTEDFKGIVSDFVLSSITNDSLPTKKVVEKSVVIKQAPVETQVESISYKSLRAFFTDNKIKPGKKVIFFNTEFTDIQEKDSQFIDLYKHETGLVCREIEEWIKNNIDFVLVEICLWLNQGNQKISIVVNSENNLLSYLVLLAAKSIGIKTFFISTSLNQLSFKHSYSYPSINKASILSDVVLVSEGIDFSTDYKNLDKKQLSYNLDFNEVSHTRVLMNLFGVEQNQQPDFVFIFDNPIHQSYNSYKKSKATFFEEFLPLLVKSQKTALIFAENISKIINDADLKKINALPNIRVINDHSRSSIRDFVKFFVGKSIILSDSPYYLFNITTGNNRVFLETNHGIVNLRQINFALNDLFDEEKLDVLDGELVADYKDAQFNLSSVKDLILKNKLNPVESEFDFLSCSTEFGINAIKTTHLYLKELLGVEQLAHYNPKDPSQIALLGVDVFTQWGVKPTSTKNAQRRLAQKNLKNTMIIEDGFIRSFAIGLSGEAGLSIILDKKTSYYDATQPSTMEDLIRTSNGLSEENLALAKRSIERIKQHRISKYNHAPNLDLMVGDKNKKKILLIDQRYGDQSVSSGLATENSFTQMLSDALKDYKDYDILIKQHPDAINGGKSSYFNDQKLSFTKYMDNVFLLNFDINPYCLFDLVDEVFVATSGMGFEALLAGKKVHCYGAPFYSGWGLTSDKIDIERRGAERTLEEVFYYSYIYLSRYFSPTLNRQCDIDEVIDYIVEGRGW